MFALLLFTCFGCIVRLAAIVATIFLGMLLFLKDATAKTLIMVTHVV